MADTAVDETTVVTPAAKKTMTKEERSAVAKAAAKKRWAKVKREKKGKTAKAKTGKAAAAPKAPKKSGKKSSPREFLSALRFAEKELTQAIREQADAAARYAAASAKIPHLHRIVSALQNNGPIYYPAGASPAPSMDQIMSDRPLAYGVPYAAPPAIPQQLHPANVAAAPQSRAQGGAVGTPLDEEENEDKFLTESNVAGGQWH